MAAVTYDSLAFTVAGNFISASVADAVTASGLDLPNDDWSLPSLPKDKLTVGTTAGKFDTPTKLYTPAAASGNVDYDLTALVDGLGNAVNFANIRYIMILNFATTAGYVLKLDGTVANAWLTPFDSIATAKLVIPPGYLDGDSNIIPGRLLLGGGSAAGSVVGGTNKVVRIAAGANTIAHAFFAVGVSA